MPRMPQPLRRFVVLGLILSALAGLLLVHNFAGAGAATVLSEPQILPGDAAPAAAYGPQSQQRIARGAETSLAVWTDVRTALNPSATLGTGNSAGSGSLQDIYAARVGADGRVIDTTPIVVDQSGFNQVYPSVGWNGSNWLVVWLAEKGGEFHTDWEVRAARVSPAGQVLDPTPIVLKPDADSAVFPFEITDDGAGNWVVTWLGVLPQEGTSIPRGAVVTKVANDGTIAMPSRVVYNHHSQYMGEPKLQRAGDRYLLTFIAIGPPYKLMGLTLDANFNQLRNGPELLSGNASGYDLATDGNAWLVTWLNGASGNIQGVYGQRVSRDGDPLDGAGFVINSNIGTLQAWTRVAFDGQLWVVTYDSGFNHATQSYTFQNDIYASRVTAAAQVLDPAGILVKAGPASATQYQPVIAPGVGGGAQIVWQELQVFDLHTARVSREGAVSPDAPLALGAPTQSEVRTATNGNGFLAVFRRDVSNTQAIMGQRLNADGTPADAAPFVITNEPTADNPSVAWNGSTYLVVWDALADGVRKTFGAVVPAAGAFAGTPTLLMTGDSPDAAGLNGQFVVVNIIQKTRQIRRTQFVRVSGAGTPVGTPVEIEGVFNFVPRVAAFGDRWLAVWEFHANHDDAPPRTHASFIAQDGSFTPVMDFGNGGVPHLAVTSDAAQALVVWSFGGDIRSRRMNADGSSPDTWTGMPVSVAPNLQTRPAATWDGQQYVVTWVDHRNEIFPRQQPKGDIFAARVARTNVPVEEFPVADSALPEETPFVIASNGLTLFSYAKFYPQAPYAAYRITTRTGRLEAPPAVTVPAAPTGLVVAQSNAGLGTITADATLTWADNANNEDGYKVERRNPGGAFEQVALLPANATSYTTSAHATQVAAYRVRAYNEGGDSAYTNEATPPQHSYPSITPNTYNEPASVRLSATASDPEGIARVEFHYATSETHPNFQLLATDTTAPYEYDWQNIPGGHYYTVAKAFDNQGSVTTVLNNNFVVYRNPSGAITSPANNAAFVPGSTVTITATARTNNNRSDEYVTGLSFYANTTLIGTIQGHYPTYAFNWTNVPAGNHSLTARPTSNLGLTGTSEPVNITVGTPSLNISGRVTNGTTPMYGVRLALSGSQSATATTDPNGNFVFTNLAPGGNYAVAASASGYTFAPASHAFTNVVAPQTANFNGTPGQPVTLDPNAVPIYTQPSDGRAVEGPSSKLVDGEQVDSEVADDFDLAAEITRVRVRGTRGGQNMPPNPNFLGIYLRFYDGSAGSPGALQAEYYLPKGAPGVVFDAAQPTTFDITLPTPFNASGRHFVSAQPVYAGTWETWWVVSGNYPNLRGSAYQKRDRLNNGEWVASSGLFAADMAFDLYGTLQSLPRVDSFAPASIPRSGLVRINGANFGTSQTTGQLRFNGIASPYIAHWADNLIVAYVPEAAPLGDVQVTVTTSAGTGSGTLNVTTRPTEGRIRWRFTVAGDYVLHRSGIGPDGTVYINDVNGRLYAVAADGALKWVFRAGAVGNVGPVTVGADGTVYVAGLVQMDAGCQASGGTPFGDGVFAVNPDGTQKWLFNRTCQGIIAGPNVGPDGKIYGVTDFSGIGAFALRPDGQVAYAVDPRTFSEHGPLGEEIVFGPSAPGLAPTQQYFQFDQSALNPQGLLFGYTLEGARVFSSPTVTSGQPAAGQRTGTVYTVTFPTGQGNRLRAYTPQGAVRWQSPITPTSSLSAPDTPPSETGVYIVQDISRLHRVSPADGSVVWTYTDPHVLFSPVASPDDRLVLMGGRITFGQPGFFAAVSNDGRLLWKQHLPTEPGFDPYGQVVPISRARFTADGQTAYIAADVAGDNPTATNPVYSFFYALNTSAEDVHVNQPPDAVMTGPASGLTFGKNTPVEVTARVTDDGAINRVEFFYNRNGFTTHFATVTAPGADGQYHATFRGTASGTHGLFVRAYDAGGLVDESETIGIIVRNSPPAVSWVSPANNSNFPPGETITLTARASDSDGRVTKVEFYSSLSAFIGEDETPDANGNYSVQFSGAPEGIHTLRAWANDDDGSRASAALDISVGPPPTPTPSPTPTPPPTPTPTPVNTGQPPSVQIVSPAHGASFAPGTSVTVEITATDPDGTVARVDLFEGAPGPGLAPLCTDFNPNADGKYTCVLSWNSPRIFDLYAQARDNSGNVATAGPVQVVFHDPNGTLKITGRVLHEQTTADHVIPIPNALVRLGLSDKPFRETRTDANGNYVFDRLTHGGRYQVTPAEPGYQFFPPSVYFEGLASDQSWDFTARGPVPPGPTPTPTPDAAALGWQAFYNGPQNLGDFDPRLALDGQGNTYVAGTSGSFGTGDTDISVIKYGPNGTQLWARTFSGDGNYKDFAADVAADPAGNVYVVGTSHRANGKYDWVTLKYSPEGALLWSRYYAGNTANQDNPSAVAVDGAGNVVVAGAAWNRDLGSSSSVYNEFTTVKYDAGGNRLWVNRYNLQKLGDGATDVTTDAQGNIYVTGTVAFNSGGARYDMMTFKYAPDGSTVWSARFDAGDGGLGRDEDTPNGIKLDAAGNVYVYGETLQDFLFVKYNAAGAQQFYRTWDASGGDYDQANDLAVDAQGNIYVTGDTLDGAYGYTTTDAATAKYSALGAQLWTSIYRGFAGRNDGAVRVRLDSAGNPYVGISSQGLGNYDAAVIRYNTDGTIRWLYRYDNPQHGDDQLYDMAVDAQGSVYFTGTGSIPNQGVDIETVKLLASTAALNAPPDVTLIINGPTIVGGPVSQRTASAAGAEGTADADGPSTNGPTIVGRTFRLSAEAFDRDGTVARVDFYANGTHLGADTAAPYTFDWTNAAPGTYAVTATATDNLGAIRSSQTETVTITADDPAPTPTPTPAPTPAPAGPVNVALAANGGAVTASSTYDSRFTAASLNNGDRKGLNWGAGGGWSDATLNAYPDWVEVAFAGPRTIDEISVFTIQDAFSSPSEPAAGMTFTKYGVTGFQAQYWTGSAWAQVPGGSVAGNNQVWRRVTFAPLTTTRVRVLVTAALDGYSRLAEVEAWQAEAAAPGRTNHALAANGGAAAASSTYDGRFPASGVNDGDRKGLNWAAGGGWSDATANAYPDWVEVTFNGAKTISEVNVFTVQNNFASPSEPTEAMTFTLYGITQFDVQAWDGAAWVTVPGGAVTGNDKVWRKFTFAPVTTTKIRVLVRGALGGYSRITEVEAY